MIDFHLPAWLAAKPGIIGDSLSFSMIEGKWAFVAALGLVLVWLIVMPRRLVGQAKGTPWYRRVRLWAVVICIIQMWIYWRFG